MNSTMISQIMGGRPDDLPEKWSGDVVEFGLLLPANRAAELLQLARSRHESVGHLLRKLIDRELAHPA